MIIFHSKNNLELWLKLKGKIYFTLFLVFCLSVLSWFMVFLLKNSATEILLWPCLLLGRLGMSYTSFWIMALFVILLVYVSRLSNIYKKHIKQAFYKKLLFLISCVLIYSCSGWIYVHYFPTPFPSIPQWNVLKENSNVTEKDIKEFLTFYTQGYRNGMLNNWIFYKEEMTFPQSAGYLEGYSQGIGEYERILPGHTVAKVRVMLQEIRGVHSSDP